jgi:hypothetical protein
MLCKHKIRNGAVIKFVYRKNWCPFKTAETCSSIRTHRNTKLFSKMLIDCSYCYQMSVLNKMPQLIIGLNTATWEHISQQWHVWYGATTPLWLLGNCWVQFRSVQAATRQLLAVAPCLPVLEPAASWRSCGPTEDSEPGSSMDLPIETQTCSAHGHSSQ